MRLLAFALWSAAGVAMADSSAACAPPDNANDAAEWNGWADAANTRFQPAAAAGLTRQSVPKLKLKWAFGFPGVTTITGNVSVVAGRLFAGAPDGTVYALNAHTGCAYWSYKAAGGVRVAPVISADGKAAYFGDLKGNVYAVEVESGRLIWKTAAEEHGGAVITGSPKLHGGRLFVPVSGRDESISAMSPVYECCTFRGSVVALDAATGKQIWKTYTISETPKVIGTNAKGARIWAPSGAVPWSSPTLDLQKNVLYIGTGVNYSLPATKTSDAILALDMETGRMLWSQQVYADDAYNFACGGQDKTNCPKTPYIDYDFGNSPILRTLSRGKRVLVAGDKSGAAWGFDPDQQGKILWKQRVGKGGVNGGFMWGGAGDEQGVAYFGLSDFTPGQPEAGGGLVALQMATGEKLWMTPAPRPACLGTAGCSAAQPAPVTLIPGIAFLGSSDGHMRAYETKRGTIIWDFDTTPEAVTANGVKAHGGSIISMAAVAAGGMLYVTSGYGGNGMPGNVLLAFSVGGN